MIQLARIYLIALLAPTANSLLHYQRLTNTNHVNAVAKNNPHTLSMRLNPTSFANTNYIISEYPRPSLRRVPNAPVADFSSPDFRSISSQMLSIMYEAKGVGLAAPQIGVNELIFVYNPSDSKNMERIVCNPTITKYSPQTIVEDEGCLSLRSDECSGQVARSEWIETQYQNELGQKVRRRLKGFEARVFQHEYDHLKGILCYDRFPPEDREAAQENMNKLLGLYDGDDALEEPDGEMVEAMQPRPLTARYMPPLNLEEEDESDTDDEEAEKEGASAGKGGFGSKKSGGFGASKGLGKKKKEKKKKGPKTRNGAFSDNPKFKTSGKTAFASRK